MGCNYTCLGIFTKCFCIPQRYVLSIMTCLALFTSYTMRIVLSISITEMVQKKPILLSNDTENYCPITENHTYVTVQDQDLLFDWTEKEQGFILSSFYWGYIITHLPAALLGEKLGGKHVLGTGMLINSLLTILFPIIIIGTNGNLILIVFVRFLMGLGQGVLYPVITTLLSQWVPPHEKTFLSSISYCGINLGTVVAYSLGGVLITAAKDWSIAFYFFGFMGLLWNLAWQLLCYSYPKMHPCLKEKERLYLEEQLQKDVSKTKLKTPWKAILTSGPVWALIVVQVGYDWGWYTLATDLPKYMNAVLKFNIRENGLWLSLPYLFMTVICLSFGFISDFLIGREILRRRTTRRLFATLGLGLGAVFLISASYVGCDRDAAVVLITLTMSVFGLYVPSVKVGPLDLSPNFSGTIMAVMNGCGVISGIVTPQFVGAVAVDQTLGEWRIVFWTTFGLYVFTTTFYLVFMSSDVQSWNNPEETI